METLRSSPLPVVAARHGVSRETIKRWIRELGYNLPPRRTNGRYVILVPDWMEQQMMEQRIIIENGRVRILRDSERGVRFSSHRPRPKAPAPEGQQTTGGQTKA